MKSSHIVVGSLMVAVLVTGCGDDDPSHIGPTPVPMVATPATPATGPEITFIGITRADDVLVQPIETSPDGVPIFARVAGATGGGSGFRLVVEAKKGTSGAAVALSTLSENVTQLPDLQVQANRALGDGSAAVCDTAQRTPGPTPGGVPAISPPSFETTTRITNAINDLACRFRDGQGETMGVDFPGDSCVKIEPTEDYDFVDGDSEVQFCGFVSAILSFPRGDTLLTVRVRDVAGNVGAPARMIIRVN